MKITQDITVVVWDDHSRRTRTWDYYGPRGDPESMLAQVMGQEGTARKQLEEWLWEMPEMIRRRPRPDREINRHAQGISWLARALSPDVAALEQCGRLLVVWMPGAQDVWQLRVLGV